MLGIRRKRKKTTAVERLKEEANIREGICLQASSLLLLKWVMWADLIFPFPEVKQLPTVQVKEPRRHLPVLVVYRGNLMLSIRHECAHPISLRQVRKTEAQGSCSAKQPYHDTHHLWTSITHVSCIYWATHKLKPRYAASLKWISFRNRLYEQNSKPKEQLAMEIQRERKRTITR